VAWLLRKEDERKEWKKMKNAKAFAGAVLLGSIAAISPVVGADDAISGEEVTPSGYCHMQVPAAQARSLTTDNPVPKDPSSGDVIDYYGPCDKKAVMQDLLNRQRLDYNHNWIMNFSD
jgi:hypothetical protein